jgi:hypothetical protein
MVHPNFPNQESTTEARETMGASAVLPDSTTSGKSERGMVPNQGSQDLGLAV